LRVGVGSGSGVAIGAGVDFRTCRPDCAEIVDIQPNAKLNATMPTKTRIRCEA
jgi:hypothetical protein